jgi:transcriptional regulator with AAA-type ATPase domain
MEERRLMWNENEVLRTFFGLGRNEVNRGLLEIANGGT